MLLFVGVWLSMLLLFFCRSMAQYVVVVFCRSMAQYAGMCNGGSPDDGFSAVSQDATTSNALDVVSVL